MTQPSDSDLQSPGGTWGTFEPVPVKLGGVAFGTERDQRVAAETMKVGLYSRRADILKALSGSGGYRYDTKSRKYYQKNQGIWVEVDEDTVPDSITDLVRQLNQIDEDLAFINDWEKGIKDRARVGGGTGVGGGGAGAIADEVTPDDIVDRYVDLTKSMLDIYKKQQDYNTNQMKEQRERILFAQKSPVEPWFNFVPVPLGRNYAAPVEENVQALAPEVTAIGQARAQSSSPGVWGAMASNIDAIRQQLYPGYAKGTRKKMRLSEKIGKRGC